ncbi:MAG TPA: dihydrodipicolinate synthase family protein [Negativicutes bacterium]|nr:dihydrodipicolinate synthase family protein [Negativicutes bacterium]
MSDFRGVFPYLVSPVDTDGTVREKVLRDLVEDLINKGVHGLTPLGSTGEFAYLTWPQRKRIVEIVVDAAGKRVPVVAGVSHAAIAEASRQAREFEKIGADGILAVLETYFPLKDAQVYDYFAAIANSVKSPVVLYTNPSFQTTDLSFDVVSQLADIPNIEYIKDASGNTGKLMTIANKLAGKIKIFSASAHIPLFVMMLGGVGWMAGPACIIPEQSVKLYNLAREKKWDEGLEYQKKLWDINMSFQKYGLAPCIKAALEIQGFDVGDPIAPLRPLSTQEKEALKQILRNVAL